MTIMEHPVRDDAGYTHLVGDFDPLSEFAGLWNTELADHYRPMLRRMFGKWECVEGNLVVAPFEPSSNSWGESTLVHLLRPVARRMGYYVYGSLNLALGPNTWIQPDVSVLHRVPSTPDTKLYVPYDHFTMPIEFVSASSRHRDRIDKPRLLATVGVPYYMTVELDGIRRTAKIEQSKLAGDSYKVIATAVTGEVFSMIEPFEASFNIDELLEPTT